MKGVDFPITVESVSIREETKENLVEGTPLGGSEERLEVVKNGGKFKNELLAAYSSGLRAPILTEAESSKKIVEAQDNGSLEARNELIESNLRLVVSIAKRYKKYCDKDLNYLDMLQEGNLGLMHAVKKFDRTKGVPFSMYAPLWIRQYILRSIREKSIQPLTSGESTQYLNIIGSHSYLRQKLGRYPTSKELAAEEIYAGPGKSKSLKRQRNKALSLQELQSDTNLSEEEIQYVLKKSRGASSLNDPIRDEGLDYQDRLVGEPSRDPFLSTVSKQISEEVQGVLAKLSDRDRAVISRRFGIAPYTKEETLEAIGKSFGLTHERIRQIEVKARKRLKEYSGSQRALENILE